MIKSKTKYYFVNKEETLVIEVNEECDYLNYKPILVKETECWRSPDRAIKYYEWVVKCLKELKEKI